MLLLPASRLWRERGLERDAVGMGLLPELRGHHKGDTVSLPYRMWHHWFMFPTSYFSIININDAPAVR